MYQGRLETISYLILKQPIRFLDGLFALKEENGPQDTDSQTE